MPTRKIFAVILNSSHTVPIVSAIDSAICHAGGSETRTRMNIVIGVKNGIIDNVIDIVDSGFVKIGVTMNHGIIMAIATGMITWRASRSEFAMAPPIA